MKKSGLFTIAIISLAACQTTTMPVASGLMRLQSQDDLGAITGRTITLGPAQSFVLSDDGVINGSWDGTPLVGTYEMRDGYFCRVLTQGPRGASPEDCQVLVLEGNNLNVTRNRGDGVSFTYTVS